MIKGVANPISRCSRYWRLHSRLELLNGASLMLGLMGAEFDTLASQIRQTQENLFSISAAFAEDSTEEQLSQVESSVDSLTLGMREKLSAAVPRDGEPQPGTIVFNPYGVTRRFQLNEVELEQIPLIEKPVYAAASAGTGKQVVVDTPSIGFTWLSAGKKRKRVPQSLPIKTYSRTISLKL